MTLVIFNQLSFREGIKKFLWSVREPNGAFRMHVDGELDVRGAYCAVTVARLSGISPNNKLFEGTAQWIAECQTYEGGFGGAPGLEAHGGYSFCGAAALALLGTTYTVNLKSLLRWAVNKQMKFEGGFQGRTVICSTLEFSEMNRRFSEQIGRRLLLILARSTRTSHSDVDREELMSRRLYNQHRRTSVP
jgi:hypothetical protein